MTSFSKILGQSSKSSISAILPFNFDLKFKLVIFPLWKNYEILGKSSVTWNWKDKGVASSCESHAHFCWVHFTMYLLFSYVTPNISAASVNCNLRLGKKFDPIVTTRTYIPRAAKVPIQRRKIDLNGLRCLILQHDFLSSCILTYFENLFLLSNGLEWQK